MEFTLKSGTNKGNRRMWIEGSRLADAGLRKGTPLVRVMNADGSLTLTTNPETAGKRHKIAGTSARPILDLCGMWVTKFIGNRPNFRVQIVRNESHTDIIINPSN
jgi:hypothetical protein